MAIDDGLRERRAADVGEVPVGPLPARLSRRRRITNVAVAVVVAPAFIGGLWFSRRAPEQAVPRPPAAPPTSPDGAATLPWLSAMVASNGTDITVYTGSDVQCKELRQPRATITEQHDQVVIAVQARIIDAGDCSTSGTAVPLAASLKEPLGDRTLRDAATASTPPTYFERDLPDLRSDKRWSPFSSHWMSTDDIWYQGYNGPEGSVLDIRAQRTAGVSRPAAVATLPIGSRRGTITGNEGGSWTVWWEAGEVTYSLRLTPSEGGTFTLKQFKQELARVAWS